MPSVVWRRWLHQTESIGSPANTATAPSPQHAARVGQAEGRCPAALLEMASVPGLPNGTPSRPRGVPYPTKHQGRFFSGTEKHPVLHQLELGAWREPRDSPSGHLWCPFSDRNHGNPSTWATVSQPRELLLLWEAKPEPQKLCRGPPREVPWAPTQQDTLGCCDALVLSP